MVHNTLHRILKINLETALKRVLRVWKWIGMNSDATGGVIKTYMFNLVQTTRFWTSLHQVR
jgi:hypothetical protein